MDDLISTCQTFKHLNSNQTSSRSIRSESFNDFKLRGTTDLISVLYTLTTLTLACLVTTKSIRDSVSDQC
jgi:hypothetical protein